MAVSAILAADLNDCGATVFYLWYTEVLNAKHLKSDHDLATSLRYLARSSGPFPGSVKWICRRIGLMAKLVHCEVVACKVHVLC
jgi:hypothetical protein